MKLIDTIAELAGLDRLNSCGYAPRAKATSSSPQPLTTSSTKHSSWRKPSPSPTTESPENPTATTRRAPDSGRLRSSPTRATNPPLIDLTLPDPSRTRHRNSSP